MERGGNPDVSGDTALNILGTGSSSVSKAIIKFDVVNPPATAGVLTKHKLLQSAVAASLCRRTPK